MILGTTLLVIFTVLCAAGFTRWALIIEHWINKNDQHQ